MVNKQFAGAGPVLATRMFRRSASRATAQTCFFLKAIVELLHVYCKLNARDFARNLALCICVFTRIAWFGVVKRKYTVNR